MKKVWKKPELVIIARNKPEEAVLTGCKAAGNVSGPDGENTSCSEVGPGGCSMCAATMAS